MKTLKPNDYQEKFMKEKGWSQGWLPLGSRISDATLDAAGYWTRSANRFGKTTLVEGRFISMALSNNKLKGNVTVT